MKRGVPGDRLLKCGETLSDARRIDEEYGLEPVIDVCSSGHLPGTTSGVQLQLVECPFCGERFETPVDTSAGSARYLEDCQICCQPIEFSLEVDHGGVIQSLSTMRGD